MFAINIMKIDNILKKIPLIKDMELSNPQVRRKSIIYFVLLVVSVLLLILNIIFSIVHPSENEEPTPESVSITMPDGRGDRTYDGADNMRRYEISNSKNRSGRFSKDIWANAEDDSFGSLKTIADSVSTANLPKMPEPAPGRTNVYNDDPYVPRQTSDEEDPESYVKRRTREIMNQHGYNEDGTPMDFGSRNKDTAQPAASGQSQTRQTPPSSSATPSKTTVEERTAEAIASSSEPAKVYRRSGSISTLDNNEDSSLSGFSSLDDGSDYFSEGDILLVKVMFSESQKIKSGQRVSLRLLEDIVVGGMLVPKNTHVMAVCNINNRLEIKVNTLELNNKIYNLNYEAYDTDGGKGLYCPQTGLSKEAAQAAAQTATTVTSRITSAINGIAGQLANIGLSAATRNVGTQSSVNVVSGYTFFLAPAE